MLYHAGAACSSIYVVQSGFFKSVTLSEDGVAQITGFPMSGDLLGLDGVGSGVHRSDVVALSRACVCVIPRNALLAVVAWNEGLAGRLFAALSEEIAAGHRWQLLLASRRADERVAAFVVDASERLAVRGYSPSDITLWMSREDIGNFLGIEVETVSRVLGRLQQRRLLDVRRRHLHICDVDALREAVAGDLRDGDPSMSTRAGRPAAGREQRATPGGARRSAGSTRRIA